MSRSILITALSIIQFLALELDFSAGKTFREFEITEIPLFIMVFYLTANVFDYIRSQNKKDLVPSIITSALFSFFMSAGHSFKTAGDLSELSFFGMKGVKTILILSGWMLFFFTCIQFIFRKLDAADPRKTFSPKSDITNGFFRSIEKKPFLTSFFTLFFLTLPGLIISYPGIMSGDIYFQIAQGYGLENKKEWAVYSPTEPELYKVVDGEKIRIDTNLSNYHPITHTMLLHGCLVIGNKLFNSDNAGLFLLIILQNLMLDLVSAWCIQVFRKCLHINPVWCLFFLGYFILHPSIRTQMICASKEGIYIPFLILFILETANYVCGKSVSAANIILMLIASAGVLLFRNEGKFILALVFFVLLIFLPQKRLLSFCFLTGTIFLAGVYELLLLPTFNVAPGNIREMMSVPFQQTARFVRDAEDEITDQEKKIIDSVLVYDLLAEYYNPDNADKVKWTYRDSATISDLKRYYCTWFAMLLKRPDIYIQATMNNYYQYFYPDLTEPNYFNYEFGAGEMWLTNRDCAEINIDLHFPAAMKRMRNSYERIRDTITTLPLIRIVWSSAIYVWILFVYSAYCLTKRNRNACIIAVPLYILVLVLITVPVNGYYSRYIFPLKATLPVVLLYGFTVISEKKRSCGSK